MKYRLTDALARTLPAPPTGNRVYYDTLAPGLGLRVTANGARSFLLAYTPSSPHRERRMTIGGIDAWSVSEARKEAKRLRRLVDAGDDPLGEKETERKAPTVDQLIDEYVERHLPSKRVRSRVEDQKLLHYIRDHIGKRKVSEVSLADVSAIHRRVSQHAPFSANRVRSLGATMFNLAVAWGYRSDNPWKQCPRNIEPPRARYLSADEITRLMAALDGEEDQQAANIIRLLLLTGARCGEVLNMRFDQLELGTGTWTKPAASTKQKVEHRLPLSQEALALLVSLPNKTPYVFPEKGTLRPRRSIRHAFDRVRHAAGLDDVRIHDLRHSHASLLVNQGYSLPVIGALLGHRTPQTTQRYAHLDDATLREAAAGVGKVVTLKRS